MNDLATAPRPYIVPVKPISPIVNPLTANDRCDSCGAQAYASALMPRADAPMLFCGHHFARFELKLHASGAVLIDERYRIAEEEARRKATGVSA
jgi:hypothetical protein